jgi:hypothetical protein
MANFDFEIIYLVWNFEHKENTGTQKNMYILDSFCPTLTASVCLSFATAFHLKFLNLYLFALFCI